MTQEDKDLLLKYLCMALPYRISIDTPCGLDKLYQIYIDEDTVFINGECFSIDNIKPYLRPMSSMTEEERNEYNNLYYQVSINVDNNGNTFRDMKILEWLHISWFLKNHFDFMGLIPKGLAIEVTEDNNPYKTKS